MELKDIHSPKDIKGLSTAELTDLSNQLRDALLAKLSAHGGHTGPNLGMVEATVALHYVFNAPEDKIVFDVSHQSYVHKMLTGRIEAFINPEHYDDVTGYTCPKESPYDLFEIGHTSTSVALAAGIAKSRDLQGGHENVVAVIGDGSLSGGEAFEALNFVAEFGTNFIVVVNDNDMSIAENHGGLYADLRRLRESNGASGTNYFKSLDLDYRYVACGNDVEELIRVFKEVKDIDHPVVVHIVTQKGKGFAPAEKNREQYHFCGAFDMPSGHPVHVSSAPSYQDITTLHLIEMAKQDSSVAVITAGTPGAIGFTPDRREQMGHQFIDVGIAEQGAVALASGLAKGGAKPFFGVVSSFIQRSYDQLSQDVAINNTPIVIGLFYASMYGMNDVTHLGWFDIALISNIPGFVFLAPTCKEEYLAMLDWAMKQTDHPVAIRMPGMKVIESGKEFPTDYSELNRFSVTRQGREVAIIAAGSFYPLGEQTADMLFAQGVAPTLVNPRFLSGVDEPLLRELEKNHRLVITLEDGVLDGGFGEKIARFYGTRDMKVKCYGLKKEFADRYDVQQLAEACHLTPTRIAEDVLGILG
ncbi:MAG: 1-deoxy-D-xylulose-5-phosphate synthase [Clostridium sp.]|nr:1-deoxy-D-xylulose-5-phosphate synthase [Clostridium sp.]